MNLKVIITALVSFTITVCGQWWHSNPFFGGQSQSPPGLQYNPIFNGQNPHGPQSNPILNGQYPPGLQYNPIFNNGLNQNPRPNPPGLQFNPYFNNPTRNISNYHPFINHYPQRNNSNPIYNYWNSKPFFSGRSLQKRALGEQVRYSPYYCIPDNYPQCNGSHSFSVGCLSPWDKALFRQCYVKPAKFFWKRQKIVNYPGDFLHPGFIRNETITAIKIQDRDCNGTGGYAQISPRTGVGYRNATIRMYSTGAGKGFNFCLQIFGK